MIAATDPSWYGLFDAEMNKEYFQSLSRFVDKAIADGECLPKESDIFRAFRLTKLKDVKVVIVGQDPYQRPGQANGLAFSIDYDVPIPPSLRNIFKELKDDLGYEPPKHGDLTVWAERGVLLLNSILTVAPGRAASHYGLGWEEFTEAVLKHLIFTQTGIVFILWGSHAQATYKRAVGNTPDIPHRAIVSSHPSQFSANFTFFGSRPFSRANEFLKEMGRSRVDWRLDVHKAK